MLWFCAWLVLSGQFNEVTLCFFVVRYSKNVCDGAFGNIRKKFSIQPVLYPEQMHVLILESATSNQVVLPITEVVEKHLRTPLNCSREAQNNEASCVLLLKISWVSHCEALQQK